MQIRHGFSEFSFLSFLFRLIEEPKIILIAIPCGRGRCADSLCLGALVVRNPG